LKINILGAEWDLEFSNYFVDERLKDYAGYTDDTIRKIVVDTGEGRSICENYEHFRKQTIRHEIIHAYMYESGLSDSWEHKTGQDETTVDWFAVQFPKLLKTFQDADAL